MTEARATTLENDLQGLWRRWQRARTELEKSRVFDQALALSEPLLQVPLAKFLGLWEKADLLQHARLGMLKALETYDPAKGGMLRQHITQNAVFSAQKALQSYGKVIRAPANRYWVERALRQRIGELRADLGREPSEAEILASARTQQEAQRLALALRNREEPEVEVLSLSVLGGKEGEEMEDFLDIVDESADVEAQVLGNGLEGMIDLLGAWLRESGRHRAHLVARTQAILRYRYADENEGASYAEIGAALGLTERQVDNALYSANTTLRQMLPDREHELLAVLN